MENEKTIWECMDDVIRSVEKLKKEIEYGRKMDREKEAEVWEDMYRTLKNPTNQGAQNDPSKKR